MAHAPKPAHDQTPSVTSQSPPSSGRFDFSAGELCLDFVNTLSDRPQGDEEKLSEPLDVLAWCEAAGLLEASRARELVERLAGDPRLGVALLERSIALRELLYRLFRAVAAGKPPPVEELPVLTREAAEAQAQAELVLTDEGIFAWSWEGREQQLDHLHWPIVRSAARLLTSGELTRVRECGGRCCSWLFVDRSRGRRRRWCDMKICGNREKARRHYRRRRGGNLPSRA